MPEAGRATAAEAKHHSRQGARAQGRLCAPIFSTLSMESMNGHVDCGQLAHGSISCRRNTWGHHQQRARTVWLGNARLRAAQGMSARGGWVQTRRGAPFAPSAAAQRPHPSRKKAAACSQSTIVGRFEFETPREKNNRHYAVMLLCDHTLRPLAGPKHWPQDGAPGGMRWGMSQYRVAAPKTRCYRPRERS
jgi:hypothetical protein